jgi:signal transduction histidine kinase
MEQTQLERLLGVAHSLTEGLELETVLLRIAEAAREVTGARYAALGVLDESGQGLERFIHAGLTDEETVAIGDLPRGLGVLGELITRPEPLRLAEVGDHPRSYGFPVDHPPMHGFLGVPIRVRGTVYGNLYLTEKQDGGFDDADEEMVLQLGDWAGIAIDNARLFGAVKERQTELERTVEVLETNVELARAIGTATQVGPVLELVVKRARALVEARGVALALRRGDGFVVTNVAGPLAAEVVGLSLPYDAPASGAAHHSAHDLVAPELERALARAAGARGSLAVPLVFRGQPLGVIAAFDRTGNDGEFTAGDERLLRAFAASASIAVASAQRATQHALRRSIEASERERARWARELHDETLQDIGALRLLLTSARNSGDPAGVATAVGQAVERLGDMGAALRDLISDLRPPLLDQLGLRPALEAMVERVARDTDTVVGLHVDLASDGDRRDRRLSPDLELEIYRVAQEAVTNAIKHAGAARVEVGVVETEATVEVSIRDDGRGFDSDASHDGFGLTGIRERVEQNGGTLAISSGAGRGTVIEVELPPRRAPAPSV